MPLTKPKQPRHLKALPQSDPPEGTRRVVLCLPDDDEWMSYFWGALSPLTWWLTWERDEAKRGKDVARYWFEVLDTAKRDYIDGRLSECDDIEQPCVTYLPSHHSIQWNPQNPFENPDYVPPGFQTPPWVKIGLDIPIAGLQEGDVFSPPTSFPGSASWEDLLTEGFARFRYTFYAPATVELHFLNVPLGGIALVTWDDNPLTFTNIDMNRDLVSAPPELIAETISEFTFETPGKHWIDVTFLPVVDDSSFPLRYGGGLRKIVLCRAEETVQFDMDVRQNPAQPCKLEKKRDNETTWTQFANLSLCKPTLRQNPVSRLIEISTDDGETWEPVPAADPPPRTGTPDDMRCLAAANAANVLIRTYEDFREKYATTDDVLVLAAIGFGILGFIFLFPPSIFALIPIIGSMIALGGLESAATDEDMREFLICLLLENATESAGVVNFDVAAVQAGLAARSEIPLLAINIMIPLFGEDGLKRAGATTAITTYDCSVCTDTPLDLISTGAAGLYGTLTYLGSGRWRIASEATSPSNHVIGIRRSGGGCFILSNQNFVSGALAYNDRILCGGGGGIGSFFGVCVSSLFGQSTSSFTIEFDAAAC